MNHFLDPVIRVSPLVPVDPKNGRQTSRNLKFLWPYAAHFTKPAHGAEWQSRWGSSENIFSALYFYLQVCA